MSFMIYDSGGRYQRRASERRRRAMSSFLFLAVLVVVSYWWGGENVRSSEVAYKQQAVKLQRERADLEKTITELRAEVQMSSARYQQLEAKYAQEVPQGAFRELADLLRARLKAGIKPERLYAVIESSRPPRNCTDPLVKRFVVKTPTYNGPHGTVSFGNGVVTVTGEGEAAMGDSGQAEAWYDPGKPVKVTFIEIGGKQTVKEGLLPLQYAVISGSKEYRFTVAAGERSFVSVTSDSCDYP